MRSCGSRSAPTYIPSHTSERDYLDGRAVVFVQLFVTGVGLIALGELVEAVAR